MMGFESLKNSTIVRAMPKGVLRILSPRAPELAAAFAERLFTTAPRHARPAWEEAALASATRRDVGATPVWIWGAERESPAVVLVHGWAGRGSQLAAFVDPLLREGFRVVTFDAPGHGDSPTRRANAIEHARALAAVAAAVGPVHAVVGHSVGAAAALFATRLGLHAERLALVAPPIGPARFVAGFAKSLALDDAVHAGMLARLERYYGVRLEHLDGAHDASCLDLPLLVVHDDGDSVVAWSDGAAIAAAAPRGRLVTTHGLGHGRILRAPEVVDEVVRFVREGARFATFAESLDGELFFRDRRVE
jgi:pimeloyl-ACP methyl ester carboxylesterase